MSLVHSDGMAEVYCADCLDASAVADVMAGRLADALIFDAPYSAKTHAGHSSGKLTADRATAFGARQRAAGKDSAEIRYAARSGAKGKDRSDLDYASFDADKIAAFCGVWLPLCSGWVVSITDDVLAPAWAEEFERAGLYAFQPLPLVEIGSRVRLSGDGPSSWSCWIVVARPRGKAFAKWGTLPGAYIQGADLRGDGRDGRIVGGKPLRSMCGIVRDYSRRGALVVDPFAGAGTTLLAAKQWGRRSIGIEADPRRSVLCGRRLKRTHEQTDLWDPSPARALVQVPLFVERA